MFLAIEIRSERGAMHGLVSNEMLLARIAGGDKTAFQALYRATAGTLNAVCLGVLRDKAAAEEVLQEAYVRVWQNARSFDPAKGAAIAWLVTIARRLALNEIRRRRGAPLSIDDAAGEVERVESARTIDDSGVSVKLRTCLDALDADYREAVVRAYVHGMTHEELARHMARPLGTVKSWVRRGLVDLKECLG